MENNCTGEFSKLVVFDPFSGGAVRGLMASLLNYNYIGIDLSAEQIEANKKRALELGLKATWICDDALNLDKYIQHNTVDLIFTCPPYGDLEQYTDDPRDLSNMDYEAFKTAYTRIIGLSLDKLRDNRFAVVVVGDFRDKQGFYRGFVADTIKAFELHGAKLYNEAILLNSIGTASMRASNSFVNRKLVKVHQNVLVFYKGDPSLIKTLYKNVDNLLPIPLPKQNALF